MTDDTQRSPFTPQTLTAYLHTHIPVTAAMGLTVETVSWSSVRLRMPIRPNLNHNRTAFGGSISSGLVMAGWSLIHNRLRSCGYYAERPGTQLVVSKSETSYLRPVAEDFTLECELPDERAWDHFLECLQRKHRGKLRVTAVAGDAAHPSARMKGAFVAISDEAESNAAPGRE